MTINLFALTANPYPATGLAFLRSQDVTICELTPNNTIPVIGKRAHVEQALRGSGSSSEDPFSNMLTPSAAFRA